MSESGLNFNTQQEIFRHNNKVLIARNRHLASLIGVRTAYDAAGLEMGQVMARNTSTGLYVKYDTDGASGAEVAVGILYCDIPVASDGSSTDVGQILIKGEVYEANLLDLDADAKTTLHGRSIVDGQGNTIFVF